MLLGRLEVILLQLIQLQMVLTYLKILISLVISSNKASLDLARSKS